MIKYQKFVKHAELRIDLQHYESQVNTKGGERFQINKSMTKCCKIKDINII